MQSKNKHIFQAPGSADGLLPDLDMYIYDFTGL